MFIQSTLIVFLKSKKGLFTEEKVVVAAEK